MDKGAALGRMAMLSEEYRERREMETGSGRQGGSGQGAQPAGFGAAHSGLLCHDAVHLLDHRKAQSRAAGTLPRAPCIREAEFLRAPLALIRPGQRPDTGRIPAAEPGKGGDGGAPRARARAGVCVYVRTRRQA